MTELVRNDPATDPIALRVEVFVATPQVYGWVLVWQPKHGMNAALALLRGARHYRSWCRSFERKTRRCRRLHARGIRLILGGRLAAYLTLAHVDVWIGPGSLEPEPAQRGPVEPLVLTVQDSPRRKRGAG